MNANDAHTGIWNTNERNTTTVVQVRFQCQYRLDRLIRSNNVL